MLPGRELQWWDRSSIQLYVNVFNSVTKTKVYLFFFIWIPQATPHVAGVAALLWSHFPDCKNNQIRNAMIHSAAAPPTNSAGWTAEYGWWVISWHLPHFFYYVKKISLFFFVYSFFSRGIVNAGYAYELLSTGCETAGGLATPLNDQELSDIAYGGKDQKNKGCTLDAHCDQFNFCHVETSECVASPPTPTPPPTVPPPCPSGQKRYQVTITTDNYPGETNYVLKNTCTGNQVLTGCGCGIAGSSFPSAEVCAEAGEMEFVINVSYYLFLRVLVFICSFQSNQLLTLSLFVYYSSGYLWRRPLLQLWSRRLCCNRRWCNKSIWRNLCIYRNENMGRMRNPSTN